MIKIKQYIAEKFIGKRYKFISNCTLPLDVVGRVVGYSIKNNNIILTVSVNEKQISIDLNHPNLYIEEL